MTRNRQVGPDHATEVLADLVPRITYKPGWSLELQEVDRGQGSQGLTLCISADVPNSLGNGRVGVYHLMPVMPAAYDRETWQRWVFEQILLVERHEAMEFYKVDGEAPYFSEHAPGRDPYALMEVKTPEQRDALAAPWSGGPPTDAHFDAS